MRIKIVKREFNGTEYCPEQRVLKLGGKNSAKVDKLEFELPEEWAKLAVSVHVQHQDGTLPTPVLLDASRSLAVDKMFTASEKGLWMLLAVGTNGYCAMTRPARYECYDTFGLEGIAEIPKSLYEQFVNQVLTAANKTNQLAQDVADAVSRAESAAKKTDADKKAAAASAETAQAGAASAKSDAEKAMAAAKRAESLAPEDGAVRSVNGKSGAVQLTAADIGAMPADRKDLVKSVTLTGSTLTVTMVDGTKTTYTTQDTLDLGKVSGVLSTAHGGTGKSSALTAGDVGAVAKGSSEYVKGLQVSGTTLVLTLGNGTTSSQTVLPAATAAKLGGIKVGSGLTVSADGTLQLTKANLTAVLGEDLADKLNRLERKMDMDGKLVYTATGAAGKTAVTMTVPSGVDYIVVRMADAARSESTGSGGVGVGVAADYGSTRIVRGGTATALVGGFVRSTAGVIAVSCGGTAMVKVTFAQNGTLSVGITGSSDTGSYPFNVEGYQYV